MLYELEKGQFGQVAELFVGAEHNRVVIDAILQGPFVARVFVDDPVNPTAAVLCPEGFFYFVGCKENNPAFLKAFGQMLFKQWQVEIVELFFFPESISTHVGLILGDRPHLRFERRDYALNKELFLARKASLDLLSEGTVLLPIDSELIGKHKPDLGLWQSEQDFLCHGFGYCLLEDEMLLSQCSVVLRSRTAVELSVRTSESHRGRGLATVVAVATIAHALELGLEPRWSCFTFNEASWRLAEKLGFELTSKKSIVLWDVYTK